MSKAYRPQAKQREILIRGLELINGAPYRVSARWLFYRLLQEGFYSKKSDYKGSYMPMISKARHANYNGWHPDILEDNTRGCIERSGQWRDVSDWLEAVGNAHCDLDKWQRQPYYVECWYEARAMTAQFEHYTTYVNLRAMGGQPSIPFKYATARALTEAHHRYQKPIVILYFGDLDKAGESISNVIERDVRKWADVPFQFIGCGLNADQVDLYNVPENPEKPGEFQWEAIPDSGAEAIITGAVNGFISQDLHLEIEQLEREAESWLQEKLATIGNEWDGDK